MAMAQQPASEMEAEMERLQRSIEMLTRSNKELKEASQQEPDPLYKQAVDENIVIIAKYKARVYALQEELRRLRGLRGTGTTEPVDALRQERQAPAAAPAAAAAAAPAAPAADGGAAADAAMGEAVAAQPPGASEEGVWL